MEKSYSQLREQRLQKIFDDCQQQVLGQIIGPFGLSLAMFEDKNGGNVTTLHNFSRDDDTYVATNSDKILHQHSKKKYSTKKSEEENLENIRDLYEIKKAPRSSDGKKWDKVREEIISRGLDDYTGLPVYGDGKTTSNTGDEVGVDLDHIIPIAEVHRTPKNHLALGKVGENSETDFSAIRDMVNSDENLALTNASANRSKRDEGLKEWAEKSRADGQTNIEKFGLDKKLVNAAQQKALQHMNQTANRALMKKQVNELLLTGGEQAVKMGLRQALGVLLVELVNGVYNEFKILIKAGVKAGKTLFQEIKERLQQVVVSVIKKIPDATSQFFHGGISGFMSNLITFLINQFISTAKRFVTVIREGLLSLFKAFKMIMFPPKNMTREQAFQEGLKILSTTIITSVGILLSESVAAFVSSTFPFLGEISGTVSNVLIGIITGLLSAFLAYQIDNIFERRRQDEKLLDAIVTDTKLQQELAMEMTNSAETSLLAITNYAESIKSYQTTGNLLATAGVDAHATVHSLALTLEMSKNQVVETKKMTLYLNETQAMLDDFLKE